MDEDVQERAGVGGVRMVDGQPSTGYFQLPLTA